MYVAPGPENDRWLEIITVRRIESSVFLINKRYKKKYMYIK